MEPTRVIHPLWVPQRFDPPALRCKGGRNAEGEACGSDGRSLDVGKGRVDYWDALVPGLRVSPERKAWCAVYRVGGRKDRLTFGTYPLTSIHDARTLAAEILRKAQRGEDPKLAEAPGPTLPLSEQLIAIARRKRCRWPLVPVR